MASTELPEMSPAVKGETWLGWRVLVAVGLGLFFWALWRTAWVTDDAYITLRTVDNFVQGHGLRWNVDERVQTYSHPLWMFCLTAAHLLVGDFYHSVMGLGASVTSAAILVLLLFVATSWPSRVVALFLLVFSKAFIDFSTSGLENPMTFFLLAVFATLHFRVQSPGKRMLCMSLVAGFAATNRLDSVLLFLPALCVHWRSVGWGKGIVLGVLGLTPLLLWLVFSTVYYGTPLPVTAYAKAMTGLPALDLAERGLAYFADVAWRDPVLLPAICLAIALAFSGRIRGGASLALGALLYCLYVVKIGGDFMSGRFLSAPLFLAALVLARWPLPGRLAPIPLVCLAGIVVLGFVGPTTSITSPSSLTVPLATPTGIMDERATYYQMSGLRSPKRLLPKAHSGPDVLPIPLDPENPTVLVWGVVGYVGLMVGPGAHFVDPWLCDPFLMRLPILDREDWRIGHFLRRVPEGYLECKASGTAQRAHPKWAGLYKDVQTVTQGPLFSRARWKAIWNLTTGAWNEELQAYVDAEYRSPPRQVVPAEELSESVPDGTYWWDKPLRLMGAGGLRVDLAEPSHAAKWTVGLDSGDLYTLRFLKGESVLGSVQQICNTDIFAGVQSYSIQVPKEAAAAGYDRIDVQVSNWDKDNIASLAYLIPGS